MPHVPTPALQSATGATVEAYTQLKTPFQAPKRERLFGSAVSGWSREASDQRLKTHGGLRAAFLTAGILLSLPFTAWAQSPSAAHNGPCRVAVVNGQHMQPSPQCHLPPPVAHNPASVANTTLADREELDRLAEHLLRQTAANAEPKLNGSSTARPRLRPEIE